MNTTTTTTIAKISTLRVMAAVLAFLPCLVSIFLMQPALVFGEPQGSETTGGSTGGAERTGSTGGTERTGDATGNGQLMNPLKSKDIMGFLMDILDILLKFALPIIIFFIMYGGFKLVTAQGETEQISTGKAAITWAVIGGVIVLGAKIIIEVIEGTVDALGA